MMLGTVSLLSTTKLDLLSSKNFCKLMIKHTNFKTKLNVSLQSNGLWSVKFKTKNNLNSNKITQQKID
jgi:hypothetical protein